MTKPLRLTGIIRTLAQAKAHAKYLAEFHGHTMCVFPVPKHSAAYDIGYRFGVCDASERAAYERDGVTIIAEVTYP